MKQAWLCPEVVGETFSFNELMRRDFWGLPMHGLDSHRTCCYHVVWVYVLQQIK